MDIQMPVMDGIEATLTIRNDAAPAGQAPIIAMTANVLAHQLDSYRRAGMNGTVAKPLSPTALIAEIARVANGGAPEINANTPAAKGSGRSLEASGTEGLIQAAISPPTMMMSEPGAGSSGSAERCYDVGGPPAHLTPCQGSLRMNPFRIEAPEEQLADLRLRLRNARWPDEAPAPGWEQGVELRWLQRLVSYWTDEFDWRAWERKLNGLPQFTWEGIHFVHKRAASGRGVPLILTHGWPSSFLDYVDVLPLLADFDVVVPSLPGYGFSPRPSQTGVNYRYVANRWRRLMTELGYHRFGAAGGDFGAGVSTFLALDHPDAVFGIHLTSLESDLVPQVADTELSDAERAYLAVNRAWGRTERGYSAIQSTKPQTIGYGLNDSPVGLAAYVGEKWRSWSDITPSDDFLCATLTLYWITQTITSSMRDYWDNRWRPATPAYVTTPTGFGVFAHETVPEGEPPRSYLERVYNIQRWTVFPKGGHFAPAEEPAAYAGDLAAFFRDLSQS